MIGFVIYTCFSILFFIVMLMLPKINKHEMDEQDIIEWVGLSIGVMLFWPVVIPIVIIGAVVSTFIYPVLVVIGKFILNLLTKFYKSGNL